jgi:aspartate-semialdehyde dehydrogenase
MTVFVKLAMAPGERAVTEAISGFRAPENVAALPSSPELPLILAKDRDHPQPRTDMETGHGMSVVVGPVQPDPLYDARFTVLVHNLVRGAAGAALLNAELFHATRPPA